MTAPSIKEKVALVTGGGRGIGRAIARHLAREGTHVFICARTEPELKETARGIQSEGGRAGYFVLDIGRPEKVRSMVSKIVKERNAIDILVNNASLLGPRSPLSDYPLKDWEEVLRVNLTGLFIVTREVLKPMIAQGSGCIVNISSGVGRAGRSRWGAYAVSKFGVEGLTQVLADELRDLPIRVMAVNPGGTRTRMRAEAYPHEDPRKLKAPEEVAGAIVRLIRSEDSALSGKSFDAQSILDRNGAG
jgi:NAD(P)-dependent dehydrogenase (short-subunit alcohol dehydrogenase family)